MCFSAEASFIAGGVLGVAGIATVRNAKEPSQIPFTAIPLIFAFQQAAEGVVWIGLENGNHEWWLNSCIYLFLILGQVVWPVLVPLSILLLEKNQSRKRIVRVIFAIGASASLYLLYCLVAYDVKAEIHSRHIKYFFDFPLSLVWISSIFYFIPVVISLFVSSRKKIAMLGVAILISFIVTKAYFESHLISVWCYFAALISITILWISSDFKKLAATKM